MPIIYNIIAELCSHVIASAEDDTLFLHYSCISPELQHRYKQHAAAFLPVLFENTDEPALPVRQLSRDDLTPMFLNALQDYIEKLKAASDVFAMISLLQLLDNSLASLLQEKIREFQTDDFSVVLNTNREATGVGLIPRCSCVWERAHRLSQSYNRLDNFLFHLLLMENSVLGELVDKHIFLKNDLFPGFAHKKSVKIAATPLLLHRPFEIVPYTEDDFQWCRIDADSSGYSTQNEAVWQKICRADEQQCDILVFPELLGNPTMCADISNRLRKKPSRLSLIVLPSAWARHMNTVTVLNGRGDILCRQSKQNPFRLVHNGRGYLESIRINRVVNILHHEGIGRIAILICKDFLATRYMEQLMRCFRLTLIIVPSFSTGSYDFRQSFDLCAHDDCNVIWINTCSALEKGKEANFGHIGYVRKRIGRNDDDSQRLCEMPICRDAFDGVCHHDCLFVETIQGV